MKGMKVIALIGALVFLAILPSYTLSDGDVSTMSPAEPASNTLTFPGSVTPPEPSTGSPQALKYKGFQTDEAYNSVLIKSQKWDKIDLSSRKLTNNQWGAPEGEKLACSVYHNPNGTFGWHWSRTSPLKNGLAAQPIYPNVRVGGSPWETSNSVYFPIKVKDTKSLEFGTEFQYPEAPQGSFNLAYDFFLTATDKSGKNPSLNAEVMIWIHGSKNQLAITYKGDYEDGYNTYELYSWRMFDGRQYFSFIMKEIPGKQTAHRVDAKKLMEKLELDPAWYIQGIELGNEVWEGSGKIEINKFEVIVNGHSA